MVSVDVMMETVQLIVGPEPDHEYVVKEALFGNQGADTIDGISLSLADDFLISEANEDVCTFSCP